MKIVGDQSVRSSERISAAGAATADRRRRLTRAHWATIDPQHANGPGLEASSTDVRPLEPRTWVYLFVQVRSIPRAVCDLHEGLRLVEDAGHPAAGVIIDVWHIERAHTSVADLATAPLDRTIGVR
jgi:hypothetical protein